AAVRGSRPAEGGRSATQTSAMSRTSNAIAGSFAGSSSSARSPAADRRLAGLASFRTAVCSHSNRLGVGTNPYPVGSLRQSTSLVKVYGRWLGLSDATDVVRAPIRSQLSEAVEGRNLPRLVY